MDGSIPFPLQSLSVPDSRSPSPVPRLMSPCSKHCVPSQSSGAQSAGDECSRTCWPGTPGKVTPLAEEPQELLVLDHCLLLCSSCETSAPRETGKTLLLMLAWWGERRSHLLSCMDAEPGFANSSCLQKQLKHFGSQVKGSHHPAHH